MNALMLFALLFPHLLYMAYDMHIYIDYIGLIHVTISNQSVKDDSCHSIHLCSKCILCCSKGYKAYTMDELIKGSIGPFSL